MIITKSKLQLLKTWLLKAPKCRAVAGTIIGKVNVLTRTLVPPQSSWTKMIIARFNTKRKSSLFEGAAIATKKTKLRSNITSETS